ncbi:MAG: hypothetical protein U0790_16735, partial [Isosphaeraceae bacterium]
MSIHPPVDRDDPLGPDSSIREPGAAAVACALAIALAMVFLTRLPVARQVPLESDEFGFLEAIEASWFPMHHTLFLTSAKAIGAAVGSPYRGFLLLDMLMSGVALASAWWWLRALVAPRPAAAGTILLGSAPLFWGYGAMAGNYTAIIAVGSFLLGVAVRSWRRPAAWHPFAAAVVLGLGTGYRQDIGTFWLPIFLVILWRHRWSRGFLAGLLFAGINLAWLSAMLHDAGGWSAYRAKSAEFAYQAGYLNSVWSLGVVDAPVRYSVKLGMALLWTLGPVILAAPRGFLRLRGREGGVALSWLLLLSMSLPLLSHLLVHFGVQGYAFHYVPALLAFCVLGIGGSRTVETQTASEAGAGGLLSSPCPRLV